jgi:iron(III) transport system permease protein|tara:strand:- start:1998 stop:3611 length:1614 start_codon:yes stop_codon:yes gene_type:complete
LEIKEKYISNSRKLILSTILLSLIVILPIIALIFSIINVDTSNFNYLWNNLLLDYSLDTIYLVLITSLFSLIFGVLPAWFISTTNFKGKNLYDILLYLPLAIPAYIMAFTYSDVLSYTGPIQSFARKYLPEFADILNQDYLQIEVLGIIMALSLYPYIYTACRLSFSLVGANYIDLSRSLGLSTTKTFFKIVIPLSRVSIFSGLFLVIMEVLNEYGAVKYFGVNTFTSGIFRSWYSMQDVQTASLLAVLLFFVVVLFFVIERFFNSRFKFNYQPNTKRYKSENPSDIKKIILHLICLVPIFLGFLIPILFIIGNVIYEFERIDFSNLFSLTANTLLVSGIASVIIILIAVYFQFLKRIIKNKAMTFFNEAISLTYALPGAVIGLSLIIMFTTFPFKSEILIGSFSLLIYAYVMRYMAVGISPLKSSFEKHPSSYDDTATNLGMGPFKLFKSIHLPINKSAIAIAFLITFVDIIKELPITLILRPFNFDTLSVQTYEYAIEEMIPKSSIYSLTIVMLGTILLIFLKKIVNKEIDVSKS